MSLESDIVRIATAAAREMAATELSQKVDRIEYELGQHLELESRDSRDTHEGGDGGGGGHGFPGPFEPVFDDGVIKEVGWGYIPFGRRFVAVRPGQPGQPLRDGLVCLKVSHVTSHVSEESGYHTFLASGLVALDVDFSEEGGISGLPDIRQEGEDGEPDLENTLLPLYVVRAGAVVLDFRHYLSLPAREDS